MMAEYLMVYDLAGEGMIQLRKLESNCWRVTISVSKFLDRFAAEVESGKPIATGAIKTKVAFRPDCVAFAYAMLQITFEVERLTKKARIEIDSTYFDIEGDVRVTPLACGHLPFSDPDMGRMRRYLDAIYDSLPKDRYSDSRIAL